MDYFYRKRELCEPGLGWGLNEQEDPLVKGCDKAIRIHKPEVEYCLSQNKPHIVGIWTKKETIYEGEFTIQPETMKKWLDKYGYYQIKGYKELVVPVVLFTKTKA